MYDYAADSWSAMSSTNAPSDRSFAMTVWTGSKMIVWGGRVNSTYENTGAVYDLASDSWTSMSTSNAPSARYYGRAVWTGNVMIVWGGYGDSGVEASGAIFLP